MLLKTAVKKIESSKVFKDFKNRNPDFYLAHAFTIIDKIQQDWQTGYYSRTKDKVVVFMIGKETQSRKSAGMPKEKLLSITRSQEEEVFKKPGERVKKLDLKKVKINLEKAIDISEKLLKKKYPAEIVTKTIVILQHLETELYNLTLVTKSLNIINIKIDANNGKVLHESRQSILGLKKND